VKLALPVSVTGTVKVEPAGDMVSDEEPVSVTVLAATKALPLPSVAEPDSGTVKLNIEPAGDAESVADPVSLTKPPGVEVLETESERNVSNE
jgi:hypothetical protein